MVIWIQISQKIKILNLFLRNEKLLPIGFQIAINHYQMMIFWKNLAKLPKIGYLGPLCVTVDTHISQIVQIELSKSMDFSLSTQIYRVERR